MSILNGTEFKKALINACNNLNNYKEYVNELNVFPVPDGDTGTNMYLTVKSGEENITDNQSDRICDIALSFSKGLLMGARGNSGVITSQIFRGFAKFIKDQESIDVITLAQAFKNGSDIAYKAIMKPVEGTILTVIRESSTQTLELVNDQFSVLEYFELLVEKAKISLEHTPELLPVLKEVGVVDSGGMGLLKIFEGLKEYFKGNLIFKNDGESVKPVKEEYGYCFEGLLKLNEKYQDNFDESILKEKLLKYGELKHFFVFENKVEVRVNSFKIGDPINNCLRYGEFEKTSLCPLKDFKESIFKQKERKKYGIITVASGTGICNLLKECGSDIVITGGQTMNPSTQDFIDAINNLDYCDNIVIFPNNSNIILAAKQAKEVLSDKVVEVIESKSIQACLSTLSMFDFEGELSDNVESIYETLSELVTASLTYAIKDTSFNGVEVKEGDFISMKDKEILVANKDKLETVYKTLDHLNSLGKELLTIVYGEDVNEEELKAIENYVSNNTSMELNLVDGGQPVYSYLFGLE